MLRPYADRVLIEPVFPTHDESLILRPENAQEEAPTQGRVVRVGTGSAQAREALCASLTSLADSLAHLQPADAADVGCGAVRKGDVLALVEKWQRRLSVPSELKVGQRVIFPPYAGEDVLVDDQRYVLVREEAILAEVED